MDEKMPRSNDSNPLNKVAEEAFAESLRFDQKTDELLLRWLRAAAVGRESAAEDLAATLHKNPGRISRAYNEMLSGYATVPNEVLTTTIEVLPSSHHGLVAANRIPFVSFCAHHFLPFAGTIDIVYEPNSKIVGIGKMPRLVDCRSRRFQLQELLVKELAEDMMAGADAKGVYVRSSAQHFCVCYRGPNHSTVVNVSTFSLGTLTDINRFAEIEMVTRSL